MRLILLTERAKVEDVLEYVTHANGAQMHDRAFVAELKRWIRFNDAQAVSTCDGLFARSSGNPTLPSWLGDSLFSLFFRDKSENDRYARQLRSSAGVAIFAGAQSAPANWFEVGRAYERFALTATVLGIRTAFVNQPIEVPAVRSDFRRVARHRLAAAGLGRAFRSGPAAALFVATAGCRRDCVT